MDIMRTKSIEQSLRDTDEPEYRLKKSLSALDLTVFGVGIIIGAGIFTLTGRVANTMSGPAVVLSFIVAALCCGTAALCYAEFAAAVPVSGSAYTFCYASMGEFVAWIIGWNLVMELVLAAAAVSQGWSSYVSVLLGHMGFSLPARFSHGGVVDLPAVVLVLVLGCLVVVGIKESMRVETVLVGLKVAIVLFVIVAGIGYINPDNYRPFIPAAVPAPAEASGLTQPLIQAVLGLQQSAFGLSGIFSGAALVFFAYLGFDVVATAAEETRNPQRDLPRGIIGSLVICTALYCAVAVVVTGMVRYDQIKPSAALAEAFSHHGKTWMATLIAAGAVVGLTTVVLTMLTGCARIVFAMSRDHLLPMRLAKVHPTYRTPWLIAAILTVAIALLAGFTPVGRLEELVNIGTLSAFILVSIGVPVLRRRQPDLPRPFRVPGSPTLPLLSAAVCIWLSLNLAVETWLFFLVWLVAGLGVYAAFGYRHSRVGTGEQLPQEPARALADHH
ncbi:MULTISPECIES: amino acid permease [unclassified Luteococcus]|uniref:amino acid permease n=1 Tax=unclassified Luteococcus TaxID=2639923 RepID=UPI00313EEA00